MILDAVATTDGTYFWMIRVFEALGDDDYKLHAEDVPEAAFTAEQIEASLLERFARVDVYDASRPEPSPSRRGCTSSAGASARPLRRSSSPAVRVKGSFSVVFSH